MSQIATMVRTLIEAGTPPDVAAVVVAEAFAAGAMSTGLPVDTAAEKRRAYDRERKQKQREEMRKSGGSPVESADCHSGAYYLSSSLDQKERKEEKKVSTRKHPCPPDWQPSENHFDAAAKLGVSRDAVLAKAEDMRIWAGANGALKKDWDLTFHGFLRRDAPKLAAQSHQPERTHAKSTPNGLAQALGKLRENIGQHDRVEAGSGPPPRLLSHG